jgi:uncharacterized protein (TIGR00369 family)
MSSGEKRQRTYEWLDAKQVQYEQRTIQGVPYFEAIRDGKLAPAPIANTIGWDVVEVERGRIKLALVPQEFLLNPHVLHGGVLSMLLDSATACAVISTMAEDQACTSLEIKVNYIRGVSIDVERIFCEGRVVHGGRQSAVAEAEIRDAAGKLYAKATATFLVFLKPKVAPPTSAAAKGA